MKIEKSAALLVMVALAFGAAPTHAVDGVIEINAATAAAGGFAGGFIDTPGFPVSISVPGSYRLTGNLIVTEIGTNAVVINSSDVTLDLNGFTIMGTGGALGSATGIRSSQANVRIQNGTVSDFTNAGIDLGGDFAMVDNVRSIGNSGIGIAVDDDAVVSNCISSENGSTGISAQFASTIRDSIATGNGVSGIFCANRCIIARNAVAQSGTVGIESNNGSKVSDNNVSLSGGNGISVNDGALVTGNSSRDNGGDGIQVHDGCTVSGNTSSVNGGHGVCAFSGNTILGNTLAGNTGRGIDALSSCGYGMNVMYDNDGGTVSAAAAEIGVNLCNGLNACP